MNIFTIARECFNQPEQYSVTTTKAQVYASLLMRQHISLEEFLILIEELKGGLLEKADLSNIHTIKRYFKLIENTAKIYQIENS